MSSFQKFFWTFNCENIDILNNLFFFFFFLLRNLKKNNLKITWWFWLFCFFFYHWIVHFYYCICHRIIYCTVFVPWGPLIGICTPLFWNMPPKSNCQRVHEGRSPGPCINCKREEVTNRYWHLSQRRDQPLFYTFVMYM